MGFRQGKQAQDAARPRGGSGGGGNNGRKLILFDRESAIGYIFGDIENDKAPEYFDGHFIERLQPGKQQQVCGDGVEGHAGCVFCHCKNKNGDRNINNNSRGALAFDDRSPFHKLEKEVRVLRTGAQPGSTKADDYRTTKYPACKGARRGCQFCAGGSEISYGGYKFLELTASHFDALIAQKEDVRSICRSCGKTDEVDGGGTIQVASYSCPHCQAELDAPNNGVSKCRACKLTLVPVETLSCSACGETDAQRAMFGDFLWKITHVGSGKNTRYTFERVKFAPLSQEEIDKADEAGMYDPKTVQNAFQPLSSEQQAALLGIPSPFQTEGHGASEYTEVDDEAYAGGETEYVEIERVNPPARTGAFSSKTPPRVPPKLPPRGAPPAGRPAGRPRFLCTGAILLTGSTSTGPPGRLASSWRFF